MYIPPNLEMDSQRAISAFIADHGFGLIVSSKLEATHLPFVFEPKEGQRGVLYGHFAKANSQWQDLENARVLVIFSGPHAYISPTWYAHFPAVPTWNYAAVHCYGGVRLLDDEETTWVLQALVSQYEPRLLQEQTIMPIDYQTRLSQAIVGFKVVIDEIQAKEKLGQHRTAADQQGVYEALQASESIDAKHLAAYMKKRSKGTGHPTGSHFG